MLSVHTRPSLYHTVDAKALKERIQTETIGTQQSLRFSGNGWKSALFLSSWLLLSQTACDESNKAIPSSSAISQPTSTAPLSTKSSSWVEKILDNLILKRSPSSNGAFFTTEEALQILWPGIEKSVGLKPFVTYCVQKLADPNSKLISREALIKHLSAMDLDGNQVFSNQEFIQSFSPFAQEYLLYRAEQVGLDSVKRQMLADILTSGQFAVSDFRLENLSHTSTNEKIRQNNLLSVVKQWDAFLNIEVSLQKRNEIGKILLDIFIKTKNMPNSSRYSPQENLLEYQQVLLKTVKETKEAVSFNVQLKSVKYNTQTLQPISETLGKPESTTLYKPAYYGTLDPDIVNERKDLIRALFQDSAFQQEVTSLRELLKVGFQKEPLQLRLDAIGKILSQKLNIPEVTIKFVKQNVQSPEEININNGAIYQVGVDRTGQIRLRECLLFTDSVRAKMQQYQENGGEPEAISKAIVKSVLTSLIHEWNHAVQRELTITPELLSQQGNQKKLRDTIAVYDRNFKAVNPAQNAYTYGGGEYYKESPVEWESYQLEPIVEEELNKLFP